MFIFGWKLLIDADMIQYNRIFRLSSYQTPVLKFSRVSGDTLQVPILRKTKKIKFKSIWITWSKQNFMLLPAVLK